MADRPIIQQFQGSPVVALPVAYQRMARPPLPTPLTPLIGREREVAELHDLLGLAEVRLLTLTGPGGVGKTRLALRVGEQVDRQFRDGAVFVDLAPIRDPDLVLPTIARALDLRETGGQNLADLLYALLPGRHLLLVLDNLEQVLGAAPRLAELLIAFPTLKILATSRALLQISGEHAFPVPPLSLQGHLTAPVDRGLRCSGTAVALIASEAVQLLVTRVQAVQPDFVLNDTNAVIVAEICRRVDCLPLGIELAAARLRYLSAASLLEHLDRRLPLLTGGPRNAPARLQTMHNAITWSYDLLSPHERAFFRQLAVFAGTFTLAAADVVGSGQRAVSSENDGRSGGEHLPVTTTRCPLPTAHSTLDLVASLVDKSLLHPTPTALGETRYGMLETIREFGLEQLAASGEDDAARQRHADWCLAFAERAGPRAKRSDAAVWLEALEREHANLRAALTWLANQGDGRRLIRMAGALWPFWQEHAYFGEGRRWLEVGLHLGGAAPAVDRLRALSGAGAAAWYQTDAARAIYWHEQALALAREVGDRRAEAFALSDLAAQATELGDYDRAIANCEAALILASAAGEPEPVVAALHNLAILTWQRGEAAAARDRLEEALALAREHDIPWLVPTILIGLGFSSSDLGDYPRAATFLHEGLELGIARGNLGDVIDAFEGLARLGAATGRAEPATRLFGAAAALRENLASPLSPTELADFEPILGALREALGAAAFTAALAAGRTLPREEAIAEAFAFHVEPRGPSPATSRSRRVDPRGLTGREIEILRLLAAGESNREIGEHLFISPTTVARHVANIRGKLGVDSRAKAAAYAHRHEIG